MLLVTHLEGCWQKPLGRARRGGLLQQHLPTPSAFPLQAMAEGVGQRMGRAFWGHSAYSLTQLESHPRQQPAGDPGTQGLLYPHAALALGVRLLGQRRHRAVAGVHCLGPRPQPSPVIPTQHPPVASSCARRVANWLWPQSPMWCDPTRPLLPTSHQIRPPPRCSIPGTPRSGKMPHMCCPICLEDSSPTPPFHPHPTGTSTKRSFWWVGVWFTPVPTGLLAWSSTSPEGRAVPSGVPTVTGAT